MNINQITYLIATRKFASISIPSYIVSNIFDDKTLYNLLSFNKNIELPICSGFDHIPFASCGGVGMASNHHNKLYLSETNRCWDLTLDLNSKKLEDFIDFSNFDTVIQSYYNLKKLVIFF